MQPLYELLLAVRLGPSSQPDASVLVKVITRHSTPRNPRQYAHHPGSTCPRHNLQAWGFPALQCAKPQRFWAFAAIYAVPGLLTLQDPGPPLLGLYLLNIVHYLVCALLGIPQQGLPL